MRRLIVLASAAALALAAVSAEAASPGFRYGVAAGEIDSTSAVLWTRAPASGLVVLAVAEGRIPGERLFNSRASRANDLTVQSVVRGLKPATTYFYAFAQGTTTSRLGSFRTAPSPTVGARVRFAISGDADATLDLNILQAQ